MPDIRYVCLSDMHLGAQNSLLTNLTSDSTGTDPLVASPVLTHLVQCLRELINQNVDKAEKPTLILNGDILELALATENEAAMVFERLIELIFPAGGDRLFKNVKYIPGNHDHHLWETAREVQYVQYIKNSSGQKPGSILGGELLFAAISLGEFCQGQPADYHKSLTLLPHFMRCWQKRKPSAPTRHALWQGFAGRGAILLHPMARCAET